MTKKKLEVPYELLQIKNFMRSKRITYKSLSKEMKYSIPHIAAVLTGGTPPTDKFVEALIKGIQKILQKDSTEFFKLMRGTKWNTILLAYLPFNLLSEDS